MIKTYIRHFIDGDTTRKLHSDLLLNESLIIDAEVYVFDDLKPVQGGILMYIRMKYEIIYIVEVKSVKYMMNVLEKNHSFNNLIKLN